MIYETLEPRYAPSPSISIDAPMVVGIDPTIDPLYPLPVEARFQWSVIAEGEGQMVVEVGPGNGSGLWATEVTPEVWHYRLPGASPFDADGPHTVFNGPGQATYQAKLGNVGEDVELCTAYEVYADDLTHTVWLDDSTQPGLDCDVDGDGIVDRVTLDADAVDVVLINRADLNSDMSVDFDDFLTLARNFGAGEVGREGGDINLNGFVDFDDFLIMARNYGA